MLGRTDRRLRHLGLLAIFVCLAVALSVRLAYWQVAQGEELRQLATDQVSRPALEFAQRGDITDRRGTLLATTAYRDLLAAYPDLLTTDRRGPVAERLAHVLGFSDAQAASLVETFEKGVPYTIVSRRLTADQSQAVRDALANGELAALSLEPQPVRFYPTPGGAPKTTLASQLLGFVTEDGEGRYGIEQYNQALLAGIDSSTAGLGTAAGEPARPGQQVSLTIDASLQLRVEKELYAIWVATQAERVSAVVMDPLTGQLLAWASVPGYDANSYAQTARTSPDRFTDPIASQIYEPGSVMKMITAAAALEAGVVQPTTIVNDERSLEFGAYQVRNSDKRSMGKLTFAEVLAYSRNVATAKVAARLGSDTESAASVLYDMWQRLGLGQASGVEVSSESRGIAADPQARRWAPVDLANRSFGQGVAVTPLQLAVAYSTMVNGGRQVKAHIVEPIGGTGASSGEQAGVRAGAQVLDPAVSQTLRELLINNVESVPEVAKKTLIEDYTVGGKTGTAQYWDSDKGSWADDSYNYTYCGFVGDGIPDLVIVVSISKPALTVQKLHLLVPKIESYEVFRRVAQTAIAVLDLPPDSAAEPASEPESAGDSPGQPGPGAQPGSSSQPSPSPAALPPAGESASPRPTSGP